MKGELLEILRCPGCGSELSLRPLKTADPASEDVDVGLLRCRRDDGHVYPVWNGIPRMLPDAPAVFRAEAQSYWDTLPTDVRELIDSLSGDRAAELPEEVRHIQDSFTAEWAELKDTADPWGQDIDDRRELFYRCVDIRSEELSRTRVLDAGCGHGEVELALLETGAEIVAVDLSFSVDIVRNRLRAAPHALAARCHVVQADVHRLPFADGVFDIGHSAGVLHHTPDTRTGFAEVSRTVRPGGTCFIEVYSCDHKNALERGLYHVEEVFRKVTIRLPHWLLHGICYAAAPALWVIVTLGNALPRKQRYIRRNLRELELALFDSLSPMFDWHHGTEEVTGWFEALGYENVRKSFYNHNVIGIVGTRRAPADGG